MHYIRCLRAPKLSLSGRASLLDLTFTITTDLGDSFLLPDEPIPLIVTVHTSDGAAKRAWPLTGKEQLSWKAGQRIAKPTLRLPPEAARALAGGQKVELCISTAPNYSADGVDDILRSRGDEDGLVMPVRTLLGAQEGEDVDTSFRRLKLGDTTGALPSSLDVSEEIGESIARHIWDGGLVATCALYGTFALPDLEASGGSCVKAVKDILSSDRPVNILEVGCGVGILGMGIASLCTALRQDSDSAHECLLLMTDLEEAEQRALSNMAQLSTLPSQQLLYENLDWEDGRKGHFGDLTASHTWDLIVLSDCTYNVDMLPALVETLSALHLHNAAQDSQAVTRVFLATKPRHSSEQALFDLMAEHGWEKAEEQALPLPVIGSEPQSVEMYLFGKK